MINIILILSGAPVGASPHRRLHPHGLGQDQGHRGRIHAAREYQGAQRKGKEVAIGGKIHP